MKAHGVLCRLVTKYELVFGDALRPRQEYFSHVWDVSLSSTQQEIKLRVQGHNTMSQVSLQFHY